MGDVILEAILDSLKTLPFLFIAYLIIEFIEHKAKSKFTTALVKSGRFGSLIGSTLGAVPQCGFSVMASNLYASGIITVGTLIAVFISTSDEAIPILASNPEGLPVVGLIIVIKVISAMIVGVVIDFIIKPKNDKHITENICAKCTCEKNGGRILVPTLIHTLKIFVFILIVTLFLNLIIFIIGEEKIALILGGSSIVQPFVCGIVGFIPNCAASVILTDLYLQNAITFGGLTAGLCTGAGVGMAVLFKANKNLKENLKIVGVIYFSGVVIGLISDLFVK